MNFAVALRRTAKFIDNKFESARRNETLCVFCECLKTMTLMTLTLSLPFLIIFLETTF
jgi:hypothetical protein